MASKHNRCKLLICNCEKTISLDAEKLQTDLDLDEKPIIHSHLCRSQIESYKSSLDTGKPLLVACTQEAPLFREIAEEASKIAPSFVNIRERAGWTRHKQDIHPKIISLLAEAEYPTQPAGLKTITSGGICLVYGSGQIALEVANELSERLSVSVVLTDAGDAIPPTVANVPVYRGKIRQISGSIGEFSIIVDGYAPMIPSSKDKLEFVMPRDGAYSSCDLIFDLTGGTPLISTHERRDGYFFVDPSHPTAIAKAMFQISDLVGEFEKPIYIAYDETICAHGRSGITGCTNCIDNCPVSAISSNGDIVVIDNSVCGGCGNCSASCPTGAIGYDYPKRRDLIGKIQTLMQSYKRAQGKNAVLLIHDEKYGSELISAIARFGRGLPANVIPVSVHSITQIGHEEILSAIASGAQKICFLCSPEKQSEYFALEFQTVLANTFLSAMGYGEGTSDLILESDPDLIEQQLYDLVLPDNTVDLIFQAAGGKREIARIVLSKLNENADIPLKNLELPDLSPYGKIKINKELCTLCLACVGACPTGAIVDNPDNPQLRFTEQACVQCGLCRKTCPENAITLEPQYNFESTSLSPQVLNEQEPFDCIRCGKPFGTKASVEHIFSVLEGKHPMFKNSEQAKVIQMCDDCRVVTLAESSNDPFKMGERPKIRTAEDYIKNDSEVEDENSRN